MTFRSLTGNLGAVDWENEKVGRGDMVGLLLEEFLRFYVVYLLVCLSHSQVCGRVAIRLYVSAPYVTQMCDFSELRL